MGMLINCYAVCMLPISRFVGLETRRYRRPYEPGYTSRQITVTKRSIELNKVELMSNRKVVRLVKNIQQNISKHYVKNL
jgi:hypothetical protein